MPWTADQLQRLAELVEVSAERLDADAVLAATDGVDQARFVAWAASLSEQTWQATVTAVDRIRQSGR